MWKIMVVDDDPFNRKLLVEILDGKANCYLYDSGTKAVEAFKAALDANSSYDLILLDIAMPDMDGIEALKRFRKLEESHGIRLGQGIPIIMVTAFKAPFMDSFKGGADDYILKPFEHDVLINKIESKIKKK